MRAILNISIDGHLALAVEELARAHGVQISALAEAAFRHFISDKRALTRWARGVAKSKSTSTSTSTSKTKKAKRVKKG